MRHFLPSQASRRIRFSRGFTLIEFILVMVTLAVVMAIAAPMLSGFFRGRKLESEARRFVSLTRFGQSQAVSDGATMILWIDRTEGTYGLRNQDGFSIRDLSNQSQEMRQRTGYEAVNPKQPAFRLAEDLHFEVDITSRTNGQMATIRFLPDGSVDETSLQVLQILQQKRNSPQRNERPSDKIWIAQTRDGSRYEIVDETNALERLLPQTGLASGIYTR